MFELFVDEMCEMKYGNSAAHTSISKPTTKLASAAITRTEKPVKSNPMDNGYTIHIEYTINEWQKSSSAAAPTPTSQVHPDIFSFGGTAQKMEYSV